MSVEFLLISLYNSKKVLLYINVMFCPPALSSERFDNASYDNILWYSWRRLWWRRRRLGEVEVEIWSDVTIAGRTDEQTNKKER